MVDSVFFPNPVQIPSSRGTEQKKPASSSGTDSSFAQVLEGKMPASGVTFSQHARERLESRGISLSRDDVQKLETAVDSVAQKGGKDSLVLVGDAALVVSVENRTVITALDRNAMVGNVFTNIDSAVIA